MIRRPARALRVRDLAKAVAFFSDQLGFSLDWTDPEGAAQVSPEEGPALLLALPETPNINRWMYEHYREVPKGGTIHLTVSVDLSQYRVALTERGLIPGTVEHNADGSKLMRLSTPDSYQIVIWQPPDLPDHELIERYATSPDLLSEALRGLTEEQLDLTRAPGKWTIRQTVHHLADSDATSLTQLMMALAEPGRTYQSNPYHQDRWVEGLNHASRPVETSLALVRAIRAHVAALVRHLPTGLDRSIETSLGGRMRVRRLLGMLLSHMVDHVEQIRQTRQVYGL